MIRFLFTAAFSFLLASAGSAEQRLYLANGEALTVFQVDPEGGQLSKPRSVPLPGAGPFTFSPDGNLLYAMAGTAKEAVMVTFQVAPDGSLKEIDSAPVNLRAGYLRTDLTGSFIAGNHYGPGKATLWKLDDGGIYRGETLQELVLEPKAHSAVFSPDNRFLLVPATGPNKVFVNRFDPASGVATPHDPPFATGPQGETEARQPRHLIFHPSKPLVYTTNEREWPGVGVWEWDPKAGTLRTVQNIVTYPPAFDGIISTADLHLTPDARFLYVSNRDNTDRKAVTGNDSIVAFKVDPSNGRLTLIDHFPCEHVPRTFTIDATGRFLYVGGQIDGFLGAYHIDGDTGALTRAARYEVGGRPIWVETTGAPGS